MTLELGPRDARRVALRARFTRALALNAMDGRRTVEAMTDPYAPVAGITLERYAELSAEVADHPQDLDAQARIVGTLGVSRADWEAAVTGWTARMQDMALMGQVASAFMPLYQAALAKKKGSVDVTYEDWVALNAAVQAYGLERALATYGIDMATWTQIAGSWNGKMSQNMMAFQQFHPTVAAEAERLRAGAPHRAVTIQRQAGGGAVVAAAPQPATPQAAAQHYQNQMMGAQVQANVAQVMAQANAQAAAAYGAAAQNVGFLGRGMLGMMGYGAIAKGVGPGMTAMVAWSDGNKYPARVMQVANDQVLVAFQNGQQIWVPESAVTAQ